MFNTWEHVTVYTPQINRELTHSKGVNFMWFIFGVISLKCLLLDKPNSFNLEAFLLLKKLLDTFVNTHTLCLHKLAEPLQ